MKLYIDTIEYDTVEIALIDESLRVLCVKKYEGRTDRLLPLVCLLCKKNRVLPRALTGIVIRHVKSTAFTSMRIGVVVANALSYLLGIPVYEVEALSTLDFSDPKTITFGLYAREPSIAVHSPIV